MTTPAWAAHLVARVCAEQGFPEPAELVWRRSSRKPNTSGRTVPVGDGYRIAITTGTDRRDHRITLLHELAHGQVGNAHHHDAEFWAAAWGLYEVYRGRVTMRYILENEGDYKRGALTVAAELGIVGAKAALRSRAQAEGGNR